MIRESYTAAEKTIMQEGLPSKQTWRVHLEQTYSGSITVRTSLSHRYGTDRSVNGEAVFRGEDAEQMARREANVRFIYLKTRHAEHVDEASDSARALAVAAAQAAVQEWREANPLPADGGI